MIHEKPLDQRRAGLLAPVFALRHKSDFGIGDTLAVRQAIDFCKRQHFAVLQILPIHETFGDHSPYNPISSRALSPALLHLSPEEVPGLKEEDLETAAPEAWRARLRQGIVKHGSVHALKMQILAIACHRFVNEADNAALYEEFAQFQSEQASWLNAYTLYRLLIREYEGNAAWEDWRPEHQSVETATAWLLRHPDRQELEDQRTCYAYAQWIAFRQWNAVRAYADENDIWLMGEVSFGVGRGSVDTWANPQLFDLEWNMGTRPLTHFDTNKDAEAWGQNWGFPCYRWENHRSTGFRWLRERVAGERRFFHICRLDHVRGYFRGYMFPWPGGVRHSEYSNLTAEEVMLKTGGRLPRFVPGPDDDPISAQMNDLQGREIIGVIREAAQGMEIIAELMGDMPEYMSRALAELPLANLAFPQLERREGVTDPAQIELRELALVTYANHDNAPLASLYFHLRQAAAADPDGKLAKDLAWLLAFAHWQGEPPETLDDALLQALQEQLFRARSKLAVLMCSDLLGVPLRFNLPGSYGLETWCNRLDYTLEEYESDAIYGPRIDRARESIIGSGR